MLKLTKRSYRRKRVVMGVALFMSIALISTGFAAFVISSQSKDDTSGNITVGTISDKNIKVEITNKESLGSFIFDTKSDDTTGRVHYDSAEESERLSVTVTGTVQNPSFVQTLKIQLVEVASIDSEGNIVAKEKEASGLFKASQKEYISLPDCFYAEQDVSFTPSGDSSVFSYTISFNWGNYFHNENPGIYFDSEYEDDSSHVKGKYVSEAQMVKDLVDLRDTIYGTNTTIAEDGSFTQDTSVAAPKYGIIVTSTPK